MQAPFFHLLLAAAAVTLPPTLAQFDDWWYREIGPGCVDGEEVYPGVPDDVLDQCDPTDPPEPLLVTNMHDCSSYYECNEGVATLICCPSGLLWDPPMQVCDDPPHVDCGSRPILPPLATTTTTTTPEPTTTTTTPEPTTTTTTPEPTTTTTTPEPTTTTTTPEPTTTTTTPEPTTTTTTPEPTTTTTTTTTELTTATTTTEKPTTTTPTTTTTTTTEAPTTTGDPPIDSKCDEIPGYDGRLPNESDCTKYFQCSGVEGDEGKVVTCEVGEYGQMVYNPTTQKCDHQWHYPCENHIQYKPDTTSWFDWLFNWF